MLLFFYVFKGFLFSWVTVDMLVALISGSCWGELKVMVLFCWISCCWPWDQDSDRVYRDRFTKTCRFIRWWSPTGSLLWKKKLLGELRRKTVVLIEMYPSWSQQNTNQEITRKFLNDLQTQALASASWKSSFVGFHTENSLEQWSASGMSTFLAHFDLSQDYKRFKVSPKWRWVITNSSLVWWLIWTSEIISSLKWYLWHFAVVFFCCTPWTVIDITQEANPKLVSFQKQKVRYWELV